MSLLGWNRCCRRAPHILRPWQNINFEWGLLSPPLERRWRNGDGAGPLKGRGEPHCLTRPRYHAHLTNLKTSASKTFSQTALTSHKPNVTPQPTAVLETLTGGGVRLVFTRAPENRGPEEFTQRTASVVKTP